MIKPGMYIGERYEIIDKVGSGGMADVYKALDHKLNRNVAIKILKQEFSTDESFVDKFRAEAQSAAGLSHPNIVNVYDVGEENGTYYIVMELIEGVTLKAFIERKGRLEIKEATGIAIQIAQGLEAAHANNIIHRDIKPQNIIISKEGKVKVADFGIAKATSSNTLTSSAMGSVHYISPEQARGGYSDEKSDIYSLGITIYEMILGRVPFEGDNAVSIALLHIQEEPRTLGELLPDMPISMDKIVQKCLNKKAERRYLSVVELVDDLKRSLIEPNVDFVEMPDVLNNSPTIALSPEDVNAIRNGALQAELSSAQSMMNGNQNFAQNMDNAGYNQGYNDYNNNLNNNFNNQNASYDTASLNDLNAYDDSYQDEEEKVDNKLEKITIIGAIVIVILIVGIIIFLIVENIPGNSKKKDDSSETPQSTEITSDKVGKEYLGSYKGMDAKKAEEELNSIGFENVELVYYDVDGVEEGIVFNQDPQDDPDSRISLSTKITLYVKKSGAQKLDSTETKTIPKSIIGKTPEAAEDDIKDLFTNGQTIVFKYEYKEDTSGSVPEGRVFQSSPAVDKSIKSTDTVVLFINKASSLVQVPNIIGKTKDEAQRILEAEGLKLDTSNIEEDSDNTSVNVNTICEQIPARGRQVEKGTAVKIHIRVEKKVEEPKKYNYAVTVTLTGRTEDNPLSEPVEGLSSTGFVNCSVTVNGVTYKNERGVSIDYDSYGTNTYTFTININNYEGELPTITPSMVSYSVTDGSGLTASSSNTTVTTTKK